MLFCLFVFPEEAFRNISIEFEAETETKNHLPGWPEGELPKQTSQTEPQTGAKPIAGKNTWDALYTCTDIGIGQHEQFMSYRTGLISETVPL